jgi:hypothetical protein
MNASISAERRGRLDAETQERKTISKNPKTTRRTVFFPVLIGAFLLLAAFHSPIIKARKSAAVWRRRTLRVRRRRRLSIQLLTKMLFPQLLCFENDPSFIGRVPGVYPLNEKIMNSTIANSSSTIDIPAVTPRHDASLPHAPTNTTALFALERLWTRRARNGSG